MVTGGCDNLVKIWSSNGSDKWVLDAELDGHTDWVRDVAVSNGIIATCSQDRSVLVWSFDSTLGVYKKVLVKEFGNFYLI